MVFPLSTPPSPTSLAQPPLFSLSLDSIGIKTRPPQKKTEKEKQTPKVNTQDMHTTKETYLFMQKSHKNMKPDTIIYNQKYVLL